MSSVRDDIDQKRNAPGQEVEQNSLLDKRLCRMCLMAVIVFAFGKEALMFI